MSTLPYLPAGQANLPAERFLIFADNANRVQRFDESYLLANGLEFPSYGISSMLNREDPSAAWHFLTFRLRYSSIVSRTFPVMFSGDGGTTWVTKSALISPTAGTRAGYATYYPRVLGEDLRFRIDFTSADSINALGFNYSIRRAGKREASL